MGDGCWQWKCVKETVDPLLLTYCMHAATEASSDVDVKDSIVYGDAWCRHATNARQQQQHHLTATAWWTRQRRRRRRLSVESQRYWPLSLSPQRTIANRQPRQRRRTAKTNERLNRTRQFYYEIIAASRGPELDGRDGDRTPGLMTVACLQPFDLLDYDQQQQQQQRSLEHRERYLPQIASNLYALLQEMSYT